MTVPNKDSSEWISNRPKMLQTQVYTRIDWFLLNTDVGEYNYLSSLEVRPVDCVGGGERWLGKGVMFREDGRGFLTCLF